MKCLYAFSKNIIYCKKAEQPASAAPPPPAAALHASQAPLALLLTQTSKLTPHDHRFFSCWVVNSMRAKTVVSSGILPGTYTVETKNIYLSKKLNNEFSSLKEFLK